MTVTQPSTVKLFDEIEGAVETLEYLAVEAAYLGEPCAQILLRTAELLRLTVMPPVTASLLGTQVSVAEQPAP
ncbi:hypothetical protein HMPREF9946_05228 [Acetobacteraceae bacterium AT-5844]|nr:hypothetical protein HMPREF9946_05228 [Acetobacteraceae bacterium AT-5844]